MSYIQHCRNNSPAANAPESEAEHPLIHSHYLPTLTSAYEYSAAGVIKPHDCNMGKTIKLVPVSKGHKPKGAHGRAAVRALGRTKTTGNFERIEKAKGKGAAIAAYQAALKAHKRRG